MVAPGQHAGKGEGVLPEKLGARFPKPLPYLWPNSAIFPTLFMTWTLHQNPVSDLRFNWIPSSDHMAKNWVTFALNFSFRPRAPENGRKTAKFWA